MANTTNFGWETPDDTDLVKDGALAMRTLGNAIDTSLVDLKGGTTGQVLSKNTNTDMDFTWVTPNDADAIQNSIVDAKGDLISATADNTPARLASSGVNGQVLTVDTTTSTGLKWAAPATGGMTELVSGNLPTNATTVTLSSISSGYNDLILVVRDWFFAAAGFINIRFNSDTGNNYGYTMANNNGSDAVVWAADNVLDRIYPHIQQARNADGNNSLYLRVNDYANTMAHKTCNYTTVNRNSANTYDAMAFGYGHWLNTNAINAITIFNDGANNFSGGSYVLYGVK